MTRICPHCGVAGAFGLGTEERLFDSAAGSLIHFEVCRNPECGGTVAVVTSGTPAREVECYPSAREDVADLLPPAARSAFQQARQSLRAGIYDGAVLMCLRSLEEATLALGAKGKTLADRIESLTKSGPAAGMLSEWAQSRTIRELMKSGGMGNGAEEAAELAEFCERFFEYVLALPARVHKSRRKLSGDAAERNPAAAAARFSTVQN